MKEEYAIQYVEGYVITYLKKQGHDELLVGLDTFTEKDKHEAAVIPTSAVWVEVNRGGLTRITEEEYQFFVAMEGSVRSFLTLSKAHIMDNTTKSWVKNEVFADSNIQFGWCLTGIILKVGEDAAEEPLEMYTDKWLTIRGYCFVDSVHEMFKQQVKRVHQKLKPYVTKYK